MNIHILTGRVGQTPESGVFKNGNTWAKFSLATNEHYKNKQGENMQTTDWHNCVVSGKLSEVVSKYVKKGDLLSIEGKVKTRSYEGKDGVKKYITETIIEKIELLNTKSESHAPTEPDVHNMYKDQPEEKKPETNYGLSDKDDDLPFAWFIPLSLGLLTASQFIETINILC